MLVNILKTFDDFGGTRRYAGENLDVPREIADKWIADGYATRDTDGRQDAPAGSAFTKNAATGLAETTVDGETFVALPTDFSGNAKAIVIGRTGTLASLLALTANEGEVAVATDQPAIVRMGADASGNVAIMHEVVCDIGSITYGSESDYYGWYLSTESVPTFRVPTGVRRIVVTSSAAGSTPHADLIALGALALSLSFDDIVRCPQIDIVLRAKLESLDAIGLGGAVISKTDVSSSAYWPAVMRFVTSDGIDNLAGLPVVLVPTSVAAVTQANAHRLIG